MPFDVSHPEIHDIVRLALAEDIGPGDITTNLTVSAEARATGRMRAKQDLTLAGIELVPVIFEAIAPGACRCELLHNSGARLKKGDDFSFVFVTGMVATERYFHCIVLNAI
mgnify:CR=1 FL=1